VPIQQLRTYIEADRIPTATARPEALIYGIQMLQKKIGREPALPDPSELDLPGIPGFIKKQKGTQE